MNRRGFLLCTAAAVTAPVAARLAPAAPVHVQMFGRAVRLHVAPVCEIGILDPVSGDYVWRQIGQVMGVPEEQL